MITIYSGRERYMRHLKAEPTGYVKSPVDMVNYAKSIISAYLKENANWRPSFKSNSPDFVSTIAHACETLQLPYKLILNGNEADLETVFKFFNKAYDLQREYLNNLKNEKTNGSV